MSTALDISHNSNTLLFLLSKCEGQNCNFVSAAVNAATLPVKDLTAERSLRSVLYSLNQHETNPWNANYGWRVISDHSSTALLFRVFPLYVFEQSSPPTRTCLMCGSGLAQPKDDPPSAGGSECGRDGLMLSKQAS